MIDLAPLETRVLLLAPTAADARVSVQLLEEYGISARAVELESELVAEIRRGAGAVVITDDASKRDSLKQLRFLVEQQPSWSELPILLLARPDFPRIDALRGFAGLVVLDRPVHVRTMISAVQAALRARLRQYELRNQLERVRAANLELHDAARAKDEFLATLSHELRNPLSALTTAAALLDRAESDPAAAHHARDVVRRQAAQMTRLLDDLLDVSRISHGRLEIRKSRCDVAAIVHSAVETVQPLMARKRHELTLSLPEYSIWLDADAVRLAQVLANLLTNAAKYTEAGGKIDLAVVEQGDFVSFSVRDNGIGIDARSQSDIFGMFSQLRPALERSEGGLGIGLALAKGLVGLHGGDITMASEGSGRGSTFTVRIPYAGDGANDARMPSADADKTTALQSDLIVADDNVDAAESLANLLEMEGHDVRVAHDGRSALQLATERMPGIMLLDIGMPGMNGYDVARAIRAEHPEGSVVLVALTGWGQPDDKRRAREAGFDHHLTKPVDFTELSEFLSRVQSGGGTGGKAVSTG